MNIKAKQNLNTMMRKAPLNEKTVSKFRDQALQTIDDAIDTFFKPEREVSEGKAAYDKLTELQGALRSYQGRFQSESKKVDKNYKKTVNEGTLKSSRDNVGKTDSLLPDGKPLENGVRDIDRARINHPRRPDIRHEQDAITQVLSKMGDVLPLFGSVAMVPGPLSVSLKDHIKETLQWSFKSSSSSQTNMNEEAFRLLTLSASKKKVTGYSSSKSENSGSAETMTVDERVMPGLHEIRSSIAQMGYEGPVSQEWSRTQRVDEFERITKPEGFWLWKKDVTRSYEANRGSLKAEGTVQTLPGRVHLNASPGNEGLSRPGAGSDLVDLVANAKLDQDFVDQLRERSLAVLDGATETLFNTKREVAEGRQKYDELSNLQRALTLAHDRFGSNGYGQDVLRDEIDKLSEVAPLYACVAMVPGEMSSSVKNHAKDLYEANSSASSAHSTRTEASSGSLFGAVSEMTGHTSGSSSSTGYVRKESITTDERIMPTLHDLRIQLDQLALEGEGEDAILTINRIEENDDRRRY